MDTMRSATKDKRTVIDIFVAFVDRLSVRRQLNVRVSCGVIGVRDA